MIEEARFELTDWQIEMLYDGPDVEAMNDEAYLDWLEGAYDDAGEGKW